MRVNAGTYISGAGHIGLITWLFVGPIFSAEPLPFDAMSVSTISGAEFEALVAETSPNTPTPVVQSVAPPSRPTQDEATLPPVVETPDEPVPDAPAVLPEAPPPAPEVSTVEPDTDSAPVPQQADRVAPEAVEEPDPETQIDDVAQEAVTDDSTGETVQPEQEATAPEEATTEIVTEAEEPASAAPLVSRRPPSTRPAAPAPTEPVQTAQEAPEETQDSSDAVNDALSEALSDTPTETTTPTGPPMSAGEKEAMRVSVSTCWNVGSLSSEALRTTVVVQVRMFETKKPDTGSIRMVSFSGGSEAAAKQAFEAARRAIIRCGSRGFDLPSEKFEHWRDIEMTFNPTGMRMK